MSLGAQRAHQRRVDGAAVGAALGRAAGARQARPPAPRSAARRRRDAARPRGRREGDLRLRRHVRVVHAHGVVAVDDDHLARPGGGGREHGGGRRERDGTAELTHPQYNDHGGEGLRPGPENARVRPLSCGACGASRSSSSLLVACVRLLVSCGGGEDAGERRGPARQGVLGRDPQRRPEARGRDRAEGPARRTRSGSRPRGRFAPTRASCRRPTSSCGSASGGGGQTITTGVLTTGDRVFLKFQDVYYEQPRGAGARRPTATLRRNGSKDDQPLSELGLDPRSWLAEAEDEGDAEVAGWTPTTCPARSTWRA